MSRTCRTVVAGSLIGLAGLAGCATNALEAQWVDPQLTAGTPLRGARVLVVCEAADEVLRRVCTDRVVAELAAVGLVAVPAPDVGISTSAPGGPAPYVGAARSADAKAVFVTAVAPASSVAKPALTLGIGIGGFGSSVGGSVGISTPIGGTKVATGYAVNASLTDVASGRLMWTARASETPTDDVNGQVAALAKKVVQGAGQAGLY